MSMALALIIIILIYLCWSYIKPSIQNVGVAAENLTEAMAKGAIVLNAKSGEDLDDALLAKLEEQRKFLKK